MTTSLIKTYNELAVMLDRDPITRWSKGENTLRSTIRDMKKELQTMREKKAAAPKPTPKKTAPKTAPKKTTKPKAAKPKATKPAPKKVAPKKTAKVATNTTTVVEIAAKLNINPKVARAKLRRRGMSATDGRWSAVKIDSKDHKKVIEILKNGRKAD